MNNQLNNRVFIVTGANAGIGYATTRQLAEQGATVIMACRSIERGAAARDAIIADTGSDRVELMQVDMGSQVSILNFVDEFTARYDRLHGLINNAANFDISVTEPTFREGIEDIFATNHVGPFLLTMRLLDVLKASAPSRILNVSSQGLVSHPFIKIHFDDLTTSQTRKYNPAYAYYHSKLAQTMFSFALARRLEGTGVSVNVIRVPNVRVDISRYPDVHPILLRMYDIKQRFAITPNEMAATYVGLISDPAYADVSGEYFDEKYNTARAPRSAYDVEAQERLWTVTEDLLKSPELA